MYENAAPCACGDQNKHAENSLFSDTPSGYSPIVNDYAFLPKRICGPLITVSNRASGAIQIAETSPMRSIRTLPCAGPMSSKVVERMSDIIPVFAMTLTANSVFNGCPVSGSIICPGESFPSNEGIALLGRRYALILKHDLGIKFVRRVP